MGVPIVVQWKQIRLVSMRMQVRSLASLSGLGDPVLLWPWPRPAAVPPIQPLGWELPYATDVALKNKN